MKKLLTIVTCATIALGLSGCGESRKALTDEEVQKHFEDKGYAFICDAINFEFCSFTNLNNKKTFLYAGSIKFVYMDNDALYSIESNKILEGLGEASEMKKQYNSAMKEVDVTTEEATKFLKAKHETYVSRQASKKKEEKNKVYKIGDTLMISDGGTTLFTFKINSVKSTDERNRFDKSSPAQVIVINYSYGNIRLNDDLFISSPHFTVIDEGGNVADEYPVLTRAYPKASPKGAKSEGDVAYGLKQKSETIKLRFSKYSPNSREKIERAFELKVD